MRGENFPEFIDQRKSTEADQQVDRALSVISEIDSVDVDKAFARVSERLHKKMQVLQFVKQVQKIAALLLIPVLVGGLYYIRRINVPGNTFSASSCYAESPAGMRSRIILPDSSIVWLNSGSCITYSIPFTESNRSVLLKGEAYFEVAQLHNAPFYVKSDKVLVKVLGTKFDFRAFNEESKTEVVLEEGKIELSFLENHAGKKWAIMPGTRAVVDNRNGNVKMENGDTEQFTSWRKGRMIFDNTPFEEVEKQIERFYGTEIMVKNPEIYRYRITTKFDNETLNDVLEMLAISSPIRISYKPSTVYPKTNEIKSRSKIIIEKK